MNDTLLQKTNNLIDLLYEAKEKFESRGDRVPDFFTEVKPFADKVKDECDAWLPLAEAFAARTRANYIHPSQLTAAAENIQSLSIYALQPDMRERRFKELLSSVDYVLHQLKTGLTESARQ
ncbi:YppE family protein [Fictibacillus iocasae]|uniref:YppE family protein n=1 Tax=Fictibacillus iocasae TaxID=2715437 RepID=A0ABW2NMX1_9BACL